MQAALIGLGMVSSTFGDAITQSEHVRLRSVYAPSASSRNKFLARFPLLGAGAAESVAAIAEDDAVDFVIVATPPGARHEIVQACAQAGKPILMEKPIERNLANATAIVELCELHELPLGIVLQHRARPILTVLRNEIADLGALHAMEVNVPWWRPQAYYDQAGRGTVERDGGGVLITQAIHTLDLMLTVLGPLVGPVVEVTAMAATTGLHTMETEDFVVAGLRFQAGAVGQLFATTAGYPGGSESMRLHFAAGSAQLTAGVVVVDHHDGSSVEFGEEASSGSAADPMAFTSDWHRAIIDDFANAISGQRPPLATGRSALQVHRLIDAIERAANSGARVNLPASDTS